MTYFPSMEPSPQERLRLEAERRRIARESEARTEINRRENERREAEARERAAEDARRAEQIRAERVEAARAQAKADKEKALEDYLASGGDPDSFEDFWKIKGPELVTQRMAEREQRALKLADPRRYLNGLSGGHTESRKPFVPPSQQV